MSRAPLLLVGVKFQNVHDEHFEIFRLFSKFLNAH